MIVPCPSAVDRVVLMQPSRCAGKSFLSAALAAVEQDLRASGADEEAIRRIKRHLFGGVV